MFESGTYVTVAVVVIGFVGQALILKGSISEKLKNISATLEKLERNVQYKDNCELTTRDFDRRVSRIETFMNGNLK